jgi:hypothetical protein
LDVGCEGKQVSTIVLCFLPEQLGECWCNLLNQKTLWVRRCEIALLDTEKDWLIWLRVVNSMKSIFSRIDPMLGTLNWVPHLLLTRMCTLLSAIFI